MSLLSNVEVLETYSLTHEIHVSLIFWKQVWWNSNEFYLEIERLLEKMLLTFILN